MSPTLPPTNEFSLLTRAVGCEALLHCLSFLPHSGARYTCHNIGACCTTIHMHCTQCASCTMTCALHHYSLLCSFACSSRRHTSQQLSIMQPCKLAHTWCMAMLNAASKASLMCSGGCNKTCHSKLVSEYVLNRTFGTILSCIFVSNNVVSPSFARFDYDNNCRCPEGECKTPLLCTASGHCATPNGCT